MATARIEREEAGEHAPSSLLGGDGGSPAAPRHYRRNIALTIAEIVCFSVAMAFADAGTVLAGFVTTLTASTVLLGLAPTLQQLGMGLPQLAVARFLAHRPRKMPFLIVASLIRNLPFFILAAVAWLGAAPPVLLTVFFVCFALFAIGMGMESVAWLDIFAKVCPPERRGRVFALGRTIANLLSFGAGFLVAGILAEEGAFPRNYALLFLAAGIFLTFALGVFMLVREPVEAPAPANPDGAAAEHPPDPGERAVLRQGRRILREDRRFRRLLAARVVYVAHFVALPFYLRYARDTIGIADAEIGRFVSASMAGQILANLVWGAVADRFGSRRVVQGALALAAALPLFALLAPRLPHDAYLLVYVATGAILAAEMIGWVNLLLELAPAERRPLYISVQSTLLLPANLLPLLGGAALNFVSYTAFFLAVALALGASLWLVTGMAPAADGAVRVGDRRSEDAER